MSGYYHHANPDDGWAYRPIELDAIWNIEVPIDEIIHGTGMMVDFHNKLIATGLAVTKAPGDIDDETAITLILNELTAELNPRPFEAEPEPIACTSLECEIEDDIHAALTEDGWVHGDPEDHDAN